MPKRALIPGIFVLLACDSPSHRSDLLQPMQQPAENEIQLMPRPAENEIRRLFEINSGGLKIDDVRHVAERKGIRFEAMPVDHSLIGCQIARRDNLNFEQYFAGMDRRHNRSLIYIVVFQPNGSVVCIETRHAYRGM
jgi:molybdopterin-guanine dinucleotide biosynthesis protein A